MIRIPGYKLQRELGVGGMATVYLATQESLQREVALKVMAQALAADRTFAKRFVGEARTIAELNHPNIVSIHDVGVTDAQQHYFAMQYLPNGDLDDKIKKRLPERELIRILLAMCGALGHAHERGFVHRDVTPGNIMFDASDQPVLTDFGIATVVSEATRMTATGLSLGTSYYMSPEQARGRSVDQRSDIYSLGGVIYEALTGSPPYQGDDSFAVAYAHVYEPVPALPPRFLRWQEVIERCMAKSPDDRYESMLELSVVLKGFMESISGRGRRAETPGALDATVEMAVPAHLINDGTSGRYRWIGLALGDRPSEWLSGLRPAVSRGLAWAGGRLSRHRFSRWAAAAVALLALAVIGYPYFGDRPAAPVSPEVPEAVAAQPPSEPINSPSAQPPVEPLEVTTVPSEQPAAPALLDLDSSDEAATAPQDLSITPQGRQRLFTLLAEAGAALDDDRLTTPPNDNAFDLFQSALSLDSDNAQALAGLRRIVSRYLVLARVKIEQGDYARSLALADRGQRVARQIDLDSATDQEVDDLAAYGFAQAMARGEQALQDGDAAGARIQFESAALFGVDDDAVSQALLRLSLAPVSRGPGAARLQDALSSGGSGPPLIVVEGADLAVGEHEITVADYRRFVSATTHPWQDQPCRNLESWLRASRNRNWQSPGFEQSDDHPVVCVSWDDASAYANWLSEETGRSYRLPGADEWQQFAGSPPPGCEDNFGDAALAGQGRRKTLECSDGHVFTAPVSSLPAAASGLYNVHGNVREWTTDCLRERNGRCRQFAAAGMSWMDGDRSAFTEMINGYDGTQRFNTIGFRVVRDL